MRWVISSLAWPDPFCAAAYRLEIISGVLQGSGLVRDFKKHCSHQWLVSVNWLTRSFNRQNSVITEEDYISLFFFCN